MAETINLSAVKYKLTAVLSTGKTVDITNAAEQIAWEENESEFSVRLNLILRDTKFEGEYISNLLPLCTYVSVYADWDGEWHEAFRGTVWVWEHSQMRNDAVTLTCYDRLYYLQKSQDNRYYAKGKKTKAVLEDIFTNWGLTMGEYTAPDVEHKKLVYKQQTISEMIKNVLEDADSIAEDDDAKSFIRSNGDVIDVLSRGQNSDIYCFSADENLIMNTTQYSMENLVTRVIVTGKEPKKGRPKVEATLDGKTEYGILQQIQAKGSDSLKKAKKEARKILKQYGSPTHTTQMQAPDFPLIRRGDKVLIKTDKLSQLYYVTGITHDAVQGLMSATMEAVDDE